MFKHTVSTKKRKEVVDITDAINELLAKKNAEKGLCNLFITHTTASLSVADLDPGTDLDLLDALEHMVPKLQYRHPHDPTHVGDHIMSTLIGPSLTVPYENSALLLGTWQRVVLIELNGPRKRTLIITLS